MTEQDLWKLTILVGELLKEHNGGKEFSPQEIHDLQIVEGWLQQITREQLRKAA